MADNDARRVWILGAGFSKSLGGPLLPRLLSAASYQDMQARYPRVATPAARAVACVYALGTNFAHGYPTDAGPRPLDVAVAKWTDAEDFLDFVDRAAAEPKSAIGVWLANMIEHHGQGFGGSLDEFNRTAKLLVAAECTAFTDNSDVASERWEPYVHWVRGLRETDAVVSFNYDRVCELVNSNFLDVARIEQGRVTANRTCAVLYKLHGSVDWRTDDDDGFKILGGSDISHRTLGVQHGTPMDLCLGTPGPSKRSTARRLRPLWDEAMDSITSATDIIFIGYRFPPSDGDARRQILDAIGSNKRRVLRIATVLGPTRSDDTQRLASLLRVAARRRSGTGVTTTFLDVVPLWAEDFVGLVDGDLRPSGGATDAL